jgi:ABC-2 type transport system permease protein
MIGRIWMVASRDLWATVTAKGFLIGLLMMPALILLGFTVLPRMLNSSAAGPPVKGEVAVIDRSAQVLPGLRAALDPKAVAARREKRAALLQNQPPAALLGQPPLLSVLERPGSASLSAEKSWLLEQPSAGPQHLALVVIPADAVTLDGKAEYGTYDLYVSKGLNDATEQALHEALRETLVSTRMKLKGVDRADIDRTLQVRQPRAVVVAQGGEQSTQPVLRRFLPMICGILLFIATMAGGQGLMMSMIEEKSSRVVEVLLAAVSPLELMCGKLLAQLAITLLMLVVYVGLGLLALGQAAAAGAIAPMLLVDLAVFFVLAYLTYGALQLTIGAAVSSVADAQSLLAPVMMLLVLPYMLSVFIGFVPNSPWVAILSFVPPVNSFIMLARLASDAPPPLWQVPLSVGIGLVFAVFVLWFAGKVFRIALLLHGKPPSIGTLVRWARMA